MCIFRIPFEDDFFSRVLLRRIFFEKWKKRISRTALRVALHAYRILPCSSDVFVYECHYVNIIRRIVGFLCHWRCWRYVVHDRKSNGQNGDRGMAGGFPNQWETERERRAYRYKKISPGSVLTPARYSQQLYYKVMFRLRSLLLLLPVPLLLH